MITLFSLAVLPAILLMVAVYRADRIEHEPPRLLAKLFGLGMLCCPIVMLPEYLGDEFIYSISGLDPELAIFLECMLVVAVCEEGVKYLMLRTVDKNPNFNYQFDGIVYAVSVGLGFATLENILYVFGVGSVSDALGTAVVRGLLAVPLHCTCAVFMGYYFGLAHRNRMLGNGAAARRDTALCLLVPMAIHGIYDTLGMSGEVWSFIVMLALVTVVFSLAYRRVKKSSTEDSPFLGPWNATPSVPESPQPGNTAGPFC